MMKAQSEAWARSSSRAAWLSARASRGRAHLLDATAQEMGRVLGRLLPRPGGHVGLLLAQRDLARHPVVLDAHVLADAVGQHVAEVLERQLPAHVLVELAVVVVA